MTESIINTSSASKASSHSVYHVRDRKGRESIWTRIGSAWPHSDGMGFNIQIDVVPLDGRINVRIRSEKSE